MGAKTKPGLNYFQIDIDFFDDPKVLLLEEKYGTKGTRILLQVLCMIYRNGYYLEYNNDTPVVLAKRVGNGITSALVSEVIDALIKFRFFDEVKFQSGVLTSKGIQKRWLSIMKNLKRIDRIKREHLLINEDDCSEEIDITSEEMIITSEVIRENTEEMAITSDSKVKKSKEEKRKEINKEVSKATSPSRSENLITELLKIFKDEYYRNRNYEYIITAMGKETQAVGVILNKIIKPKYPQADTNEVKIRARTLFQKCIEISDKWHSERMSPTHIAYNYNQLLKHFKQERSIINGRAKEIPDFLKAKTGIN